jgi:hypothetical protein
LRAAATLPSPPSASGSRCTRACGARDRKPCSTARATWPAVSEPLNLSGAMSTEVISGSSALPLPAGRCRIGTPHSEPPLHRPSPPAISDRADKHRLSARSFRAPVPTPEPRTTSGTSGRRKT